MKKNMFITVTLFFVFYICSHLYAYKVSEKEIDYWIKEITKDPYSDISYLTFVKPDKLVMQTISSSLKIDDFPLEELKELANKGNPKAQYLLAIWYYSFNPQRSNYGLASKYFSNLVKIGSLKSKLILSQMSIRGLSSEISITDSINFLKSYIDKGSLKALNIMGEMYYKNKDIKKALELYKHSAEKNNPEAMYAMYKLLNYNPEIEELSLKLDKAIKDSDLDKSKEYMEQLRKYNNNLDYSSNKDSNKWFNKAIEANNPNAMLMSFYFYRSSPEELEKNENIEKAFELAKKLSKIEQSTGVFAFLFNGLVKNNEILLKKGEELLDIYASNDKDGKKYLVFKLLDSLTLSGKLEELLNFYKKESVNYSGLTKDIIKLNEFQLEKDFDNLPKSIDKILDNLEEKKLSELDSYIFYKLLSAIINYEVFLCEKYLADFNYMTIAADYEKPILSNPYFFNQGHKNITSKLSFEEHFRNYVSKLDQWEKKLKENLIKVQKQKLIPITKVKCYSNAFREFLKKSQSLKKELNENAETIIESNKNLASKEITDNNSRDKVSSDTTSNEGNNNKQEKTLNDIFVIKDIDLELIKCHAGSFMMGSQEKEAGRNDFVDKETLHKVTFSKDFYIGKYEITQKQYQKIMGNNPSQFKGDNNPVEKVCWEEAIEFCNRLNQKYSDLLPKDYIFILPTEAQWEYACRAGTATTLNSGKNITTSEDACLNLDEVAWYEHNSNKETHPIGQKKPNSWGIYDMHGNVSEWCLDWVKEYSGVDIIDPLCSNGNFIRVSRGGAWNYPPGSCRSAARGNGCPSIKYNNTGFRVVLMSKSIKFNILDNEINEKDFPNNPSNKVLTFKDINLEMVECPAGSFMMGSPEEELGKYYASERLHKVTISKNFYIGKYEITQDQFESIMGKNPSYFKAPDKPVERVSWEEAKDFCEKLNLKFTEKLPQGYKFDLPTEAQWEYACRAGIKTALNRGKNITTDEWTQACPNVDKVAWYFYNSGKTTHTVGQKEPNGWGIYDMHGNVEEWCKDYLGYKTYAEVEDDAVVDPVELKDDGYSYRVNRGGGWNSGPAQCRSGMRNGFNKPSNECGFRVALVPVD